MTKRTSTADPERLVEGSADDRLGDALGDLEDDFVRTGQAVSYADVDRAAERHDLSPIDHAELLSRAASAGYLQQPGPSDLDVRLARRSHRRVREGSADSLSLLLRDLDRYPLLDARQEIELGRAIDAGQRAAAERTEPMVSGPLDKVIERGLVAKQHLVASNIRLVISVARRYCGQGLDLADLVQAGTMGLIRAAEKFDWRLGYKFSTYATWWIRQSITRHIADTGRTIRIPVHVLERVNRLRHIANELEQRSGRKPGVSELAEALGCELAEAAFLRDVAQDTLSLDALVSDDAAFVDFIPSVVPGPEAAVMDSVVADDVRAVLQVLTDRQREVIVLRYGLDGKDSQTLEQIGQVYSVTRERIRQIEDVAKKTIRKVLIDRGYGQA